MISISDRRLPISLLVSKALLIVRALSDFTFGIKSAFDSKSAFRYHFWMQKCKIGAFFGLPVQLWSYKAIYKYLSRSYEG